MNDRSNDDYVQSEEYYYIIMCQQTGSKSLKADVTCFSLCWQKMYTVR